MGCREQDRRTKTENTRRETERLLRGQQAELEVKKADMARRDVERNTAREAAAAQANALNVAAKAKVRGCQCLYGMESMRSGALVCSNACVTSSGLGGWLPGLQSALYACVHSCK